MKKIMTSVLALFMTALLLACGNTEPAAVTTDAPSVTEDTGLTTDDPATAEITTEAVPETTAEPEPKRESIEDLVPSSGSKLKIACIGDSITYGWGASNISANSYPAQLQKKLGTKDYTVGNFGLNSSYVLPPDSPYNVKDKERSYRVTDEYKNSLAFNPDVVVIMLGTNDIRSMTVPAAARAFKKAYKELIDSYLELPSVQKVYVATTINHINSTVIKQAMGPMQDLEREVAEEMGLPVIDVYGLTRDFFSTVMHLTNDRVHPNDKYYYAIADTVYDGLLGNKAVPVEVPEASGDVVYVSAKGRNTYDGSSPERAVNSLGYAVGLLSKKGGTVVVCGHYALTYATYLPANVKPVKITSVYNGKDYRTDGADLEIGYDLFISGDIVFDDIEMLVSANGLGIFCQFNSVTFGEGFSTSFKSGTKVQCTLFAGYDSGLAGFDGATASFDGECSIVVSGGSWLCFFGGNRRSKDTYALGEVGKDAVINITINGGEFAGKSGTNRCAAVGDNSTHGTVNLTINGGSFTGTVFALKKMTVSAGNGKYIMDGNLNIVLNGGTFADPAVDDQPRDQMTTLTGKITVTDNASKGN